MIADFPAPRGCTSTTPWAIPNLSYRRPLLLDAPRTARVLLRLSRCLPRVRSNGNTGIFDEVILEKETVCLIA